MPLQHFVFPSASEGLYLVVDEKGAFREDNFNKAMGSLQGAADSGSPTHPAPPDRRPNPTSRCRCTRCRGRRQAHGEEGAAQQWR